MTIPPDDDTAPRSIHASVSTPPAYADVWVGHRARQRRLEVGLSLKRVADDMGISKNQLMKFEAGENRLTCGRLYDIAMSLNTEPGWFFEKMDDAPEFARPKLDSLDLLANGDTVDVLRMYARLTKQQALAIRTTLENLCVGNQAIADSVQQQQDETG